MAYLGYVGVNKVSGGSLIQYSYNKLVLHKLFPLCQPFVLTRFLIKNKFVKSHRNHNLTFKYKTLRICSLENEFIIRLAPFIYNKLKD